jgi:hypothetical protein
MATLNSPGTLVSVVNESFYAPAAPGTVPVVFVASASNKQNGSGTGTALGTLDANAGKVYTITSQRDLVDTFGVPFFETDASGNSVHAGELNEYGLQAAYSLLGVSSQAYVVRADVDLGQLSPSSSVPNGEPAAGTYWLDTDNSVYGVSQWDAENKLFVNKTPLVIDNDNKETVADLSGSMWVPKASFGTQGSYAMVVTSENTNQLWFKNTDNVWVDVGSNEETEFSSGGFSSTCWQTSWPVVKSTGFGAVNTGSTLSVNGITVTLGATVTPTGVASSINAQMYTYGVGARVVDNRLAIYADATAASNGSTADGKIALSEVGTATNVLTRLGLVSGTYGAVELAVQPHTQVPRFSANKNPTGSVYVKTTAPNSGANWSVKYYNGSTKTWGTVSTPMYTSSESATYAYDKAGGLNIPVGTLFVEYNYDHGTGANETTPKLASFKVHRRNAVAPTTISYNVPTSFVSFNTSTTSTFFIKETVANSASFGVAKTVTLQPGASLNDFVTAVSAAGLTNVSANYNSTARVMSLSHALGGEIKLLNGTNSPLTGAGNNALGFTAYNMVTKTGTANLYATGDYEGDAYTLKASNWKPLVFEAKASAPFTMPADGQLWFNPEVSEVDVMYHDGTTWVGYLTAFPQSDPNGPQVSAVAPTTQSDGTPLADGDIWVSTADLENYGRNVYVWNGSTLKWIVQDPTDQVTSNGWLFADARWATTGQAEAASTIKDLLSSDYLDPDAPDPALYPEGMRLWNLRRSNNNVKKYVRNYINVEANDGLNLRFNNDVMNDDNNPYFADRWVSSSPNAQDGAGTFGRLAQRGVVVAALKSLVDTNQAVRDTDTLVFNLISCPGYPELVQNMVAFNNDRRQTAFVLADTPFRLAANATELSAWGMNTNGALDNGDVGAVTYDEYAAFYYPSGFTNDNTGNAIVVPPSHIMMRTIARSDNVSYPWFAPAGLRRGTVDNVSSVGYVDKTTGEFTRVALYEGLRDVLAQNGKINPISDLPGSGLVVMGQYTRANAASALDRVNVARLVCYLRRQLEILARPFLFEPNDKITRDEIKESAESLLLELVGQRALYDFIVVCDESNNTPARIDRNELWMDIAIEPVKAVEFIYIPLRLVNTGAIAAGNV